MSKSPFPMIFAWVLIPALCLSGPTGWAQSAWNLKKDKNNIRIYTRSVNSSKFNELKAVLDLPGTPGQLRSVIMDVTQYKNWVYSTAASRLIQRNGDSVVTYYSRVSAPWPLSDRDFYSVTQIRTDSAGQKMYIASHSIDNQPLAKNFVRVPYLKAEWIVSVSSPDTLHVEYTLSWNPGGNIPAWIVNMFSTVGPFQSFSLLKNKLSRMEPPALATK